ncbi:MAG: Rrf2 family transcriptional regulator [Nitratireductor sp.]|jgi:Rrf2 family nitric oxide-sensitive transcriptional repressor|nr:Rrf2 family transcriptional regulator [Nitratireductor sp.]
MRLTLFTDYGLRMLMRLASEPQKMFSTAELAGEFGLSRNHLAKIIQRLAGAGLVETRRGGGGGAMLARPAGEIRLGEVVALLEEGQAIVECFAEDGGRCTIDGRCGLKARLRSAQAAFMADLNRSTIADIALPAGKQGVPAKQVPLASGEQQG